MLSKEAIRYYATHPAEFVQDIIKANPDPNQAEILNSLVYNQMTSVRSGHGVGKSAVEAWAVIWFIVTHPYPKIPCTAPTQHQLFDILWAEISKWKRNNKVLDTELIWTKEKLYMRGHSEEWFAVARTASTPDALQGFHAEHMLYIIDEASGVDDKIFEPVLGALSTPGARLLMCGNPTQLSGFFYDSHNKNREQYSKFHIDGRNSARVSQEFVQTIINMYGEDSDVFRVRVSGDFPLAEDDIYISLPLVEKSIQTEYIPRKKPDIIHIGCDVARFGTDKTVIGYRTDKKVQFFKKRVGQDTMKTADDIVLLGSLLVDQYKLKKGIDLPIPIKVDDSGVGGGVVDRLRQLKRNNPSRFWWMEIYPVQFGKKIRHKFYDDSTTYMMSVLKRLLSPHDEDGNPKEVEVVLPDDDALVAQISGRKYGITENGKIRVESKKVMKARGVQSPDEADCVLLVCLPVKRPKKKKGAD
ncbi:MAG: terminase B [Eubacteriales bacterium]|nr:terminase B [Eubacteriales bacterium]